MLSISSCNLSPKQSIQGSNTTGSTEDRYAPHTVRCELLVDRKYFSFSEGSVINNDAVLTEKEEQKKEGKATCGWQVTAHYLKEKGFPPNQVGKKGNILTAGDPLTFHAKRLFVPIEKRPFPNTNVLMDAKPIPIGKSELNKLHIPFDIRDFENPVADPNSPEFNQVTFAPTEENDKLLAYQYKYKNLTLYSPEGRADNNVPIVITAHGYQDNQAEPIKIKLPEEVEIAFYGEVGKFLGAYHRTVVGSEPDFYASVKALKEDYVQVKRLTLAAKEKQTYRDLFGTDSGYIPNFQLEKVASPWWREEHIDFETEVFKVPSIIASLNDSDPRSMAILAKHSSRIFVTPRRSAGTLSIDEVLKQVLEIFPKPPRIELYMCTAEKGTSTVSTPNTHTYGLGYDYKKVEGSQKFKARVRFIAPFGYSNPPITPRSDESPKEMLDKETCYSHLESNEVKIDKAAWEKVQPETGEIGHNDIGHPVTRYA